MVPLSERVEDAAQRRVPGHWEGDLIIGKNGASCAATLVERMSGFTELLALPSKHAEPTAEAVIEHFNDLPQMMKASLAWDQGSEMAQQAKVNRPGFVRGSQVPRRRVPVRGGCDGRSPRVRRAGSCRSRRAVAGG